ncbi:hypothetical protein EKH77_32775 [Streptomyces luteoverticillatus]|uniref:DUF3829 domain-containing protein n=1 Tax=Streptomyces luteoverticillatus TaxID=66425 RepID=A0A3S9PSC3_STRLT|nr:DUF5995 family protein [Streptomyces luteoverticillatus]AZQ75281.1 hypothetical protein EKH77_32775 [Streptomyces luteoverticillatus]
MPTLVRTIAAAATMTLLYVVSPPTAQAAALGGQVQPGAVSCAGSVPGCVRRLEHTLATVRDELGCDHRAPFAALYVRVQESLQHVLRDRPTFFTEPTWAARDLNAAFVSRYLDAYRSDRNGQPVPRAWSIAFTVARTGQTNAAQDALLGANAHIQRDMSYVLAELGLVAPNGISRKADFDRAQAVLDRAYEPAVQDLTRHYDPLLAAADARWNPVANLTAHELLVLWRRNAWHYAERLTAAATPEEFRRVSAAIEDNAAAWGTLLAAVQVPGYRLVRDGYCRGGRTGTPVSPSRAWTPPQLPASLASGRLPRGD